MATEDSPFVVFTPQPILHQFRLWATQAAAVGKLLDFIAVLKDVNRRLETNPHGWGDLLREYATLNAVQRRGLVANWFLLWYGVDDSARQVVVQHLLPAPGSPLAAGSTEG